MDEISYNTANDNANGQWSDKRGDVELTGTVVEKIDKSKLEYVTKADCKHERISRRPADDFDDGIDEILCLSCPMGWFERRK